MDTRPFSNPHVNGRSTKNPFTQRRLITDVKRQYKQLEKMGSKILQIPENTNKGAVKIRDGKKLFSQCSYDIQALVRAKC